MTTFKSDKEWLDYLTRPSRFLLVEDDEPVRSVFKAYVKLFNFEVDEAGEGAQAIEMFVQAKIAEMPYDAILLDLMLPDIHGTEVFKRIRQLDPDVPVVIVSGHISEDVMDKVNDIGVASFMRKPHDFRSSSFMLQLFAHLGVRRFTSLPSRAIAQTPSSSQQQLPQP